MRISYNVPTSQNNNYKSSSLHTNSIASNYSINNGDKIKKSPVNPKYYLHFMGIDQSNQSYDNDSKLLNYCNNRMKLTMSNFFNLYTENYHEDSKGFVFALKGINDVDGDLYNSILNTTPQKYKTIEKNYKSFKALTLDSLDEVHNGNEKYTAYWMKHKKIGDSSAMSIINNSLGEANPLNINDKISNLGDRDYAKLKNNFIATWAKAEFESNPKDDFETNYKTLVALEDKNKVDRLLLNKQYDLNDSFDALTKDKIYSSDHTLIKSGFDVVSVYVENKLKNESGEDLEKDLRTVINAQNGIALAQKRESFTDAKPHINSLYTLAKEQWSNTTMRDEMSNLIFKKITVANVEKKDPRIKNFESYDNLDIDKKLFIANYMILKGYDENKKRYNYNGKEDSLQKIVNDKTLDNSFDGSFETMTSKINSETSAYFNNIDRMYDYISEKRKDSSIQYPERVSFVPNGNFDFVNEIYSKIDNYFSDKSDIYELKGVNARDSRESTISYLTKDEMTLIGDSMKQDFLKNDSVSLVQDVVRSQASSVDIHNKMHSELKKINLNLGEMKVIMNNQSQSLDSILKCQSSEVTQKNENKLSNTISQTEDEYNSLPKDLQQTVDTEVDIAVKSILSTLPGGSKTNDEQVKMLKLLGKKGEQQYIRPNMAFQSMQNILLIRAVQSSLGHKQDGALGSAITNGISSGYTSGGINGAVSGGLGAIGIDPALAAMIAITMVTKKIVNDVQKVKSLESGQRDLIFTLD